jgi:hypothetical protein
MSKVTTKLQAIQSSLNAPKNLENKFGNYRYRSAESILEALKPHLEEHQAILTLSDEIVEVGGRVYVKATATFTADDQTVSTTAFAREAEDKKGMDPAQVTGACSSYARKYALNGLFCIDDTKDADATETHGMKEPAKPAPAAKPAAPKADDSLITKIIESFQSQTTLEGLDAKLEKAKTTPYGTDVKVLHAYDVAAANLLSK